MKEEKSHRYPSPLIVGGHSFITELGNDPAINFDTQLDIVNECLDQGINCFDTTYEPERLALGRILDSLGRHDEAQVIAWSFFVDSVTNKYLVAPQPFKSHHIEQLLNQLRTDYIDLLVVHPVGDEKSDTEQVEIAQSWVASGKVGALGTWAPTKDPARQFGFQNPYDFMVLPRNINSPNTDTFAACSALGWRTFATSPFERGWLLDRLVSIHMERTSEKPETSRARIADALLRFAIHGPHVNHLIVGFRKKEWISRNIESVSRGPLSIEEEQWLSDLQEQAKSNDEREQNASADAEKMHR